MKAVTDTQYKFGILSLVFIAIMGMLTNVHQTQQERSV